MSGCVAIDYQPQRGLLASIVALVNIEGFTLINIRVIPCADGKRETLTLNLNIESRSEWLQLETKLRQLDGVLDVIHCSELEPSAPGPRAGYLQERSHSRASATVSNT